MVHRLLKVPSGDTSPLWESLCGLPSLSPPLSWDSLSSWTLGAFLSSPQDSKKTSPTSSLECPERPQCESFGGRGSGSLNKTPEAQQIFSGNASSPWTPAHASVCLFPKAFSPKEKIKYSGAPSEQVSVWYKLESPGKSPSLPPSRERPPFCLAQHSQTFMFPAYRYHLWKSHSERFSLYTL